MNKCTGAGKWHTAPGGNAEIYFHTRRLFFRHHCYARGVIVKPLRHIGLGGVAPHGKQTVMSQRRVWQIATSTGGPQIRFASYAARQQTSTNITCQSRFFF